MYAASRSLTLLLSGVLSAAMALFHSFLPRIYGWEADLGHTPSELGWALLSLNCFFSLLLFCAGVVAVASWWQPALCFSSSLTLASFWCVNVAYQWLVPPPWPRTIALALLAFAIFVAVLSLCAVAASLNRRIRLAW